MSLSSHDHINVGRGVRDIMIVVKERKRRGKGHVIAFRSSVLIMTSSRQMVTSMLSCDMSRESHLESVSTGAIFVPGITCQMRLKF